MRWNGARARFSAIWSAFSRNPEFSAGAALSTLFVVAQPVASPAIRIAWQAAAASRCRSMIPLPCCADRILPRSSSPWTSVRHRRQLAPPLAQRAISGRARERGIGDLDRIRDAAGAMQSDRVDAGVARLFRRELGDAAQ